MPRPPDRSRSFQWLRVSLRAQGVAPLVVPLGALFAALCFIFWMESDVREADQTVVSFYDTRSELVRLRSSLEDAGIALGGFSATRAEAVPGIFRGGPESGRGGLETGCRR